MPTELPHYKQKQAILHAKDTSPETLRKFGLSFLEAGWLNDAIDFLQKAKDTDGLAQIRRLVVQEGDVFLFRRLLKVTESAAAEGEWKALGDAALVLGKLEFAREAYRLSGDRKAMDKVELLINPAPVPSAETPPAAPLAGPATGA